MSRAPRAGLTVLAWIAAIAITAACSSTNGRSGANVATGTTVGASPSVTSARAAPVTTPAGRLPTVPNCGGGAYKPQTLLIVCGSGTTMATGVSWRSWEPGLASGSGTVHLQVKGHPASAPATLQLSEVVDGPGSPQFSALTVTWTATPPDGKARETFHLQVQG
jgi:hypothetical protein